MTIASTSPPYPSAETFRDDLLAHGVLVETSVPGLYHRSAAFEAVVRGPEALATAAGRELGVDTPALHFPPVMPRESFLHTDYLRSFPNLIGSVEVFTGGDREHAELLRVVDEDGEWSRALSPAEVVLCSSACHPLYGTLPTSVPDAGVLVECQGWVFRHEPSLDPARMQCFRQHEFVHVGTPDSALAHRDAWLQRGLALLTGLGLDVVGEVANDPFFGRAGRMLIANQRTTALKYEIVAPLWDGGATAIASANYHSDHFGVTFGLTGSDGQPAHSACIGFGLERITLALLARHGLDPADWPAGVREQLKR